MQPAIAGALDRHVGARRGEIEAQLDYLGLRRLAEPRQTLVEPVQTPNIIRMLAGAAQGIVEPQIGAVNGLGLLDPALLQQQRAPRHGGSACIQPQGSS